MQTKQEINAEGKKRWEHHQEGGDKLTGLLRPQEKQREPAADTHAAAGLSGDVLFCSTNNISSKSIRDDAGKIQSQQVNHKWMRGVDPTHKHCFRILFKKCNEDGQDRAERERWRQWEQRRKELEFKENVWNGKQKNEINP